MINQESIRYLKNCTVAVGVMKPKTVVPIAVFGSGFIVDSDGYVVTATHVLNACIDFCKFYTEKNKIEVRPAVFSFREKSDGSTDVLYSAIDKKSFLKLRTPKGDMNLDVVVVNLLAKGDNLPYLEISDKKKPDVLSDIIMTGYPSGNTTLNFGGGLLDMRFYPLIHLGKISGLIPTDSAPSPQLLQTDIITTGGSSGSPLIDPTDLKVLGISQKVISGNLRAKASYEDSVYFLIDKEDSEQPEKILSEKILEKSVKIQGFAVVGPVMGITNNMIQGIPQVVSEMKKGNYNIEGIKMDFSYIQNFVIQKDEK